MMTCGLLARRRLRGGHWSASAKQYDPWTVGRAPMSVVGHIADIKRYALWVAIGWIVLQNSL
jgi:hypothetical protein